MTMEREVPCAACGARTRGAVKRQCTAKGATFGRELEFIECGECKFAHAPGNFHNYESEGDFAIESRVHDRHDRVGTASRPGREYQMAVLCNDLLLRTGTTARSVLIYGPGLSMDYLWISKYLPDAKVSICDLKNFQGIKNFTELDSTDTFDIVIACEVAEHFVDIRKEFGRLLLKVATNGIAILSTNIRDKSNLDSLIYPFIPGHTAYYSGRALTAIVQQIDSDMRIDFRTPEASLGQLGSRKRYVLLSRNPDIAPAIAEYFAENFMAPSEKTEHPVPVRIGYWLHRHFPTLSNALTKALRR